MTDVMTQPTAAIPVWSLLVAAGLGLGLFLFPDQAVRAIRSLADSIRDILQRGEELLAGALTRTWQSVVPSQPVNPMHWTFGIIFFAVGVGASVATYLVLQPTLEILLPFDDASRAVAFVMVALNGALGVRLHLATGRAAKVGVLLCALAFVASTSVLAWRRAVVIQQLDLPDAAMAVDYTLPIISTVLTALLEVAQFAVFAGAFTLAGEAFPILLVAPVLLLFGGSWIVVQLAGRCEIHRLLNSVAEELAAAARAVRALLGRLRHALSSEGRRQRKHLGEIDKVTKASELEATRSGLDEQRATDAWTRAEQATARDAATAHERAMRTVATTTDQTVAGKIAEVVGEKAAKFAEELVDTALAQVRPRIDKEIAAEAPAVVKEVARSAFAAVRPLTYFGTKAKPTDTNGRPTVN